MAANPTEGGEANSAKIAEIRARAERIVRDLDADTTDVALARDVLALVEVVEAAQDLMVSRHQQSGWGEDADISEEFARLEQALTLPSLMLEEAK